jgi:replication-associated recombination protein RarA
MESRIERGNGLSQLWQQARIATLDEMVGNADALGALRAVQSGFVLIYGPMGCGKTSTALAWAKERTGVAIEESQTVSAPGKYHVQHVHASLFELDDAVNRKIFFYWSTPTLLLVDEAHEMTLKRQQSKLKTIPNRPDLTLVLITSEPDQIEASIRDRCAKIRLGPLSARELKPMVERACRVRSFPFDNTITQALNRAEIFRPRAILNVVDSLSRGVPLAQAIVGQ